MNLLNKTFQLELPIEPKEIKPHPHGVELGILIKMLKNTKSRTLQSFLTSDFCRVGAKTAKKICEQAGVNSNARPKNIARDDADNLIKSITSLLFASPFIPLGSSFSLTSISTTSAAIIPSPQSVFLIPV